MVSLLLFWCRDKRSIEQQSAILESLFKYSCMQQMIAPRDQTASRLCSRNYPVLPRCRCPSGPPKPSATRCFRRFCAPSRLHLIHRPASDPAAPWPGAQPSPHRSKTPTHPLPRTIHCRGASFPMSGNAPGFFLDLSAACLIVKLSILSPLFLFRQP